MDIAKHQHQTPTIRLQPNSSNFLMMFVRNFALVSSSVSFALTSTSFHFTDFLCCCCCRCWFCCFLPFFSHPKFNAESLPRRNCGPRWRKRPPFLLLAGNLNALKIKSDFMNIDWLLLPWMKIRFRATFSWWFFFSGCLLVPGRTSCFPVPLSRYCLAWISHPHLVSFLGKLN